MLLAKYFWGQETRKKHQIQKRKKLTKTRLPPLKKLFQLHRGEHNRKKPRKYEEKNITRTTEKPIYATMRQEKTKKNRKT